MELEGRDLKLRMKGDEVEALQRELRRIGYPVDDRVACLGTTAQCFLESRFPSGSLLPRTIPTLGYS